MDQVADIPSPEVMPVETLEASLLGAAIALPTVAARFASDIASAWFTGPRFTVAEHIRKAVLDGVHVSEVLLTSRGVPAAEVDAYVSHTPTGHQLETIVGLLGAEYRRQETLRAAQLLAGAVGVVGADVDEAVSDALTRIRAADVGGGGHVEQTARQAVGSLLADGGGRVVPSGFPALDEVVKFRAGNMVIVGARPGVGKSMFALNAALNAARQGTRVLYVSLEMANSEVIARALVNETDGAVTTDSIADGTADRTTRQFTEAVDNLSELPITFSYSPHCVVEDIAAAAVQNRVDLVVVDYLQLLVGTDGRMSRQEAVSAVSRKMKQLGGKLDCVIMALSQLKRVDGRRPVLSDLRESGSLEQDADIVILLHRDPDDAQSDEVIIAKNRGGRAEVTINAVMDPNRAAWVLAETSAPSATTQDSGFVDAF